MKGAVKGQQSQSLCFRKCNFGYCSALLMVENFQKKYVLKVVVFDDPAARSLAFE